MLEAVLLGFVAAVCLGTSDFIARSTSLLFGAAAAFTYVVLIGSALMTVFVVGSGVEITFSRMGLLLTCLHGVSVAAMSLMLYAALARGPISLAVPIVAAHPVLVLVYGVATGVAPLSLTQGLASALVIIGVISASVLSLKEASPQAVASEKANATGTLLLALGACLAYALLIISGQAAAAEIGQLEVAWIGRLVSALLLLAALLGGAFHLPKPGIGLLPLLTQSLLDTLGYVALLAGGLSLFPGMTAVTASTFGFVTILLSFLVAGERLGPLQWVAIGLSFLGIAWLVAGH